MVIKNLLKIIYGALLLYKNPLIYLKDKLGLFTEEYITVKLRNGLKFKSPFGEFGYKLNHRGAGF